LQLEKDLAICRKTVEKLFRIQTKKNLVEMLRKIE
jgi:hypothetical protein